MSNKSPFEITAQALKIMGKKIAAPKGAAVGTNLCVFISVNDSHAIATDGHMLAVLDLNRYGNFSKHEILSELAFYADMQVINFSNGHAMITAEKKEDFILFSGKGLDDPTFEKIEDTFLDFADWKKCLPPAEALQHVSVTDAVFSPGRIGLLDKVADAFNVLPIADGTIANQLYGAESEGLHICVLNGLLLAVSPLKQHKEEIGIKPSKSTIQSFFKMTPFEQTEMDFDSDEQNESEA